MPKGAREIAHRFNDQLDKTFKTILEIVIIILFSSISIACLVVGVSRKSQCPLETKIPTWLIVYGSVGIVWNTIYIISLVIKFCFCRDEENEAACNACVKCLQSFVGVFMLVWVILGSVWFFKVKSSVQFTDVWDQDSYCDKGMFNFVFALLLISYIFPALICCCCCCICVCACCGIILDDDSDN